MTGFDRIAPLRTDGVSVYVRDPDGNLVELTSREPTDVERCRGNGDLLGSSRGADE